MSVYKEEFLNGSILIKQKNFKGEELDLGVLLGKKENKKFIGLQMKFYGASSKLSKPITKESIKEKIQKILINCLKNYGIKITEWHYIMCLYYNPEELNLLGEHLINNCKSHDLQYIFYNPVKAQFYDRDKKPIDNLQLDFKTNIDFTSIGNPYNLFIDTGFLKDYSLQTCEESNISISHNIFEMDLKTVKEYCEKLLKKEIEPICKFKLVDDNNFPILEIRN